MTDETTPLTEADLAEMRERSEIALSEDENPEADEVYASAIDVPYLFAEVDRLRAEVERRERQIGLHLKLANEAVKRADALAAKLAAVRELVEEAVARMEPVSWVDALRAALGEDGGTDG